MKIAIVGRPKVGKTTLAKKLAKELGLIIHHTDDSIKDVPFANSAHYWIDKLKGLDSYIVEGVQVARMLRSGAKDGSWKPDKLFIVDATHETAKKHRGLASLCNNAVSEWCKNHPDIRVEKIINEIEPEAPKQAARQSYMSEARKQVDGE